MAFDEYKDYDAVGLAALISKKEIQNNEVLDAALERAAAVNPKINAIIRPMEAEARRTIKQGLQAGPLSGVPYLMKDISAPVAGVPTSSGSRVFANIPNAAEGAIVRGYRQAGLVIFGKTNTPEFGVSATTEPVLFGPTRNPWNLDLTAGGSSGGSAAAVAAGIVPAAHATDGGGSIRVPASCCGLFGLKPSRGRVSQAPAGEGWGPLSAQHAVSRTVRDSALLLDISCRPQPGDPYRLEPPAESFLSQVGRQVGRLRIGFSTRALAMGSLDEDCVRAVHEAASLCAELGHEVDEIDVPGDFEQLIAASGRIVRAHLARTLDNEAERRGAPIREDEVETLTWKYYTAGRATTAARYVGALHVIHAFSRTLSRVFETHDVILNSTLGSRPIPLGALNTNATDLHGYSDALLSFAPNTQIYNASGLPAASVPLSWTTDGLPIGVQFAANYGEEALLFRLAGQLEAARPWAHRRPDLS